MTASNTFDVVSSLDGYGAASANWSGYRGRQGPELLDRSLAYTARSSEWSSEPTPIEISCKCWRRWAVFPGGVRLRLTACTQARRWNVRGYYSKGTHSRLVAVVRILWRLRAHFPCRQLFVS
jgi:hypothetical protein